MSNKNKHLTFDERLSPSDMKLIDDIVSPRLLNGQSVRAIYLDQADALPCSERTLYSYIEQNYLTAKTIDLPRKVRYKVRYKHADHGRNHDRFAIDRTYDDFRKYIDEHTDISIVEMDTVIGRPGGKVLLTLFFRSCSVLAAFLMPDKSQNSVIWRLNNLCDKLGLELFRQTFGVILTDRGTEFSNPLAIECDDDGESKTHVFYCDPYCSWQKGRIEKCHEFIRYVLPSGSSFDGLTQEDITLLMSHINSYPRSSLNGKAPIELARLLLDEKVLRVLQYAHIPAGSVMLKPALLRKNKYQDNS